MYARLHVLALLLLLFLLPASGIAQDHRPLREARSENDHYRLQIDAGRGESRRCRAALFERTSAQQRARRLWREKLVNEVAPRHALIRDDGRFVVTLDEFRRGGAAHALVIYDKLGKLLREFGLRELLHGDDWKHVTVEQRAVVWLSEAEFTFVDSPPRFVVKLDWGRELRIDLEAIELVRETSRTAGQTSKPAGGAHAAAESDATDGVIPPEILALLETPTSAPASDGETAREVATAEEVLRALAQLQQLSDLSGVDANIADMIAGAGLTDAVAAIHGPAATVVDPNQPRYAGLSAEFGLPVPPPNPADPVDYVAWVVALTETEGPSAVPLYESAIAKRVPWEGDEGVYEAARRGDPEALASPEIIEWLEANQDALADFHAAAQLEYRGMIEVGEDYSVIGILLPSLSEKRRLARTALIGANRFEANGDVDAAVGCYLSNLTIGAQTSQGPTLIENLVGIALQAENADRLLDCFASERGDEIDYVQLADQLEAEYQPVRPIAECFQGERAMMLDVLQRAYEWNPENGTYRVAENGLEQINEMFGFAEDDGATPKTLAMSFALGNVGFENTVAQANECYDDLSKAVVLPYQEAQRELDELAAEMRSPTFRMENPLLSTLMPSLSRASHIATRSATTRNATRLIANLRAYRQEYGQYPDTLDVFGDADMTIDPFTSDRFVYQRDGDDFTLYSLGGNGVDDGGVHDRRANTNDVLYWPRPSNN